MTRKDYELLAGVFAKTRPTEAQFTTTSADGNNTMFDGISYKASYGAWETTIRALCDALQADNPAFDRSRFQFAATTPREFDPEGRFKVWLAEYRFRLPAGQPESEALSMATSQAKRDVPDAAVELIRIRQTPGGVTVVTVKRVRE